MMILFAICVIAIAVSDGSGKELQKVVNERGAETPTTYRGNVKEHFADMSRSSNVTGYNVHPANGKQSKVNVRSIARDTTSKLSNLSASQQYRRDPQALNGFLNPRGNENTAKVNPRGLDEASLRSGTRYVSAVTFKTLASGGNGYPNNITIHVDTQAVDDNLNSSQPDNKNSTAEKKTASIPPAGNSPGPIPPGGIEKNDPGVGNSQGNFPDSKFPGVDFPGGNFPGVDFPGGNFPGVDFPGGNFPGVDYPGGNFPGVDFPGGNFPGVDFPGGNFPGVDFPGGNFPGVDFPGGNFPGVDFPGGNFPGVDFPGGNFPGVDIPGGNFPGVDFPGGNFPGVDIPGGNFPGVDIPGGNFPGVNFPGVNIPGGNFPGVNLPRGNFPGVNIPGGNFPGVNFPGGSFPGVDIPGGNFPRVNFPGVNIPGVNFPGGYLSGVNLPVGNLPVLNFPGVYIPIVHFSGVNFPGVNFPGVNSPGGTAGVSIPRGNIPGYFFNLGFSGLIPPGIGSQRVHTPGDNSLRQRLDYSLPSGGKHHNRIHFPGVNYPGINVPDAFRDESNRDTHSQEVNYPGIYVRHVESHSAPDGRYARSFSDDRGSQATGYSNGHVYGSYPYHRLWIPENSPGDNNYPGSLDDRVPHHNPANHYPYYRGVVDNDAYKATDFFPETPSLRGNPHNVLLHKMRADDCFDRIGSEVLDPYGYVANHLDNMQDEVYSPEAGGRRSEVYVDDDVGSSYGAIEKALGEDAFANRYPKIVALDNKYPVYKHASGVSCKVEKPLELKCDTFVCSQLPKNVLCGTDGNVYYNRCHLDFTLHCSDHNVKLAYKGTCTANSPYKSTYKTLLRNIRFH